MVFTNQVIMALDDKQPTTRAELSDISGLGPKRIDRFGQDILEIIQQTKLDVNQGALSKEEEEPR